MNIDDLLFLRHPLPRLLEQQVESMQQLPKTGCAEQVQLLRMGDAAYRYHQLADGQITEADFQHWLAGLPPRMRQEMATAGHRRLRGQQQLGLSPPHARTPRPRLRGLHAATALG